MISNSTEGVYMGTEHKAGFENSRMKGSLTIVGLGLEGYRKAINDMAAYLRDHPSEAKA